MNESRQKQRRNAPRIRCNQIAYLNFQSGNGGIVLDVSTEGFGFQAVEPLKAKEFLAFRVSVPGFRHIPLSGHVVWLDDTRKRGGLRVIVPVTERRTFNQWQQQFWIVLPPAKPCHPEAVSEGQFEAKESRTSRNVLVGCLMLALCIAVVGGPHFLKTAIRIGDLLTQTGSKDSERSQATTAHPQQNAAQVVPPAAQSPHSRTRHARATPKRPSTRLAAHLFAPAPSESATAKHQSGARLFSVPAEPSARTAKPQPLPPINARISTANANSVISGELRNPDSLPRFSNAPAVIPQSKVRPEAPALAVSAEAGARSTVPSGRRTFTKRFEATDTNSRTEVPKSAPEAVASAAQNPESSHTHETRAVLKPCRLVNSVQPVYPKEARKQRIEGDVKLRLVVGTNGGVKSVESLSGPPLLVAAAMDAARRLQYRPALLNGHPIETIQTIEISFRLAR